ncbi:MAG TPA: flagellar motor protein MotB [Bacillales bacterium]|nr:flagellar motor protein MotB [Bacillales bacterium]
MRRNRRRKGHGNEDHERWMITYADMITLLLIFFIVLYSMSEVQKVKFNALIESLHDAFAIKTMETAETNELGLDVPRMPSFNQKIPEQDKSNEEQLDELYMKLQHYIQEHHLTTQLTLVDLPRGVQITFQDKILFDLGKAELKEQALEVLGDVGGLLKTVNNPISIEGHTDDLPIESSEFPSNWELSTARAQSVRRYLQEHIKVDPTRLRIVGYGQYHPKVPNDSDAHRAENRRVNIVILRHSNAEGEAMSDR